MVSEIFIEPALGGNVFLCFLKTKNEVKLKTNLFFSLTRSKPVLPILRPKRNKKKLFSNFQFGDCPLKLKEDICNFRKKLKNIPDRQQCVQFRKSKKW